MNTNNASISASMDYLRPAKAGFATKRRARVGRSAPADNIDSGVTELVFTRHSSEEELLLLPMLAHLSRNANRWITWISSTPIDREKLRSFGVNTSKVQLLRAEDEEDCKWLLWEALAAGTSDTVVAAPGLLDASQIKTLEQAALTGASKALIISYRQG